MTPAAPLRDPAALPLSVADTETRNNTCCLCACRSGIRVHLRDGEVRDIESSPDHPLNRGVICAKGSSGITKPLLAGAADAAADGPVRAPVPYARRLLSRQHGRGHVRFEQAVR